MSKGAKEAALKAYPDGEIYIFGDASMACRVAMQKGYEQAEKELGWHSVKESLPPIDEEVIVLTDDIQGTIVPESHYICYGHIVDKNIVVNYDGWNIPRVTHWMYLPKLEEEK